jgi:DNA-binding NarL/FixJ family response regulator
LRIGVIRLGRAAAVVSSVRVLIVEDFEPMRQFVRATLGKRPGLQIVGEASEGLEAVRKAAELKPDLIVLDVGLPRLNGLEVARQTREIVPGSKIIFLSQESAPDIVQEAFALGAWGYVFKTNAGNDLLLAVEAVLSGREFRSGS